MSFLKSSKKKNKIFSPINQYTLEDIKPFADLSLSRISAHHVTNPNNISNGSSRILFARNCLSTENSKSRSKSADKKKNSNYSFS